MTMKAHFKLLDKNITLEWSNIQILREVLGRQTSFFGKTIDDLTEDFMSEVIEREYIDIVEKIVQHTTLPESPVVLDVGSGTSIIDMILYSYFDRKATFYLLDGEYFSSSTGGGKRMHDPNFQPFNDWQPAIDVIETCGFDTNHFNFIDTNWKWSGETFLPNKDTDQWKDLSVDLVVSKSAYGLHFPIETYWEKVKSVLKPGGWLVISPMLNIGDQYQSICREFGLPKFSEEVKMSRMREVRPNDIPYWEKVLGDTSDDAVWGYKAVWQRPL